jgi:hypothetical protein
MIVYVLIKSYQNKWVILGQELTENNLRNSEFDHSARSATFTLPVRVPRCSTSASYNLE